MARGGNASNEFFDITKVSFNFVAQATYFPQLPGSEAQTEYDMIIQISGITS